MRTSRLAVLLAAAVLAAIALVVPGSAASAAPKPLAVSTASLPDSTEGIRYVAQLKATGGTAPYTWSVVAGSLPDGLTLSSSGKVTGYQGFFAHTSDVTVQVADKTHATAVRALTLTIHLMAITTTSVPAARKGVLYSTKIKFYGGCSNPGWTVHDARYNGITNGTGKGILPDGVLIHAGGVISGVPKTAGTYPFTVLAACQNAPFAPTNPFLPGAWSRVLTLTVG
ncbi:MAG: S-layer domain protein [Marmoricola sp.]|nr:S-layer domain protein [Marmoricola sp.]